MGINRPRRFLKNNTLKINIMTPQEAQVILENKQIVIADKYYKFERGGRLTITSEGDPVYTRYSISSKVDVF
jgi:hypothetical protein